MNVSLFIRVQVPTMENPNHKWRFLAAKNIYFYGPSTNHGYVSHNQRVYPIEIPLNHYKFLIKSH